MKRTLALTIGAVALVLYLGLYIWQPGGERFLTVVTDVALVAFSVLAAVFASSASRMFEPGEPQRRVWLIFGAGLALWAVAELVWACYEIILNIEAPFPSLADIPWALGYIPLFTGLMLQYRALGVGVDARRRLITASIFGVVLIVVFISVLWPMFLNPQEETTAGIFLNVLYPVGDLCLALVATLSLLVLGGSLLGMPWLHISIGMLLFAAADLAYAYSTWNGTYTTGGNLISGFVDVVYLASYITTFIGAYGQATFSLLDFKFQQT
jgi:hypothetical protein